MISETSIKTFLTLVRVGSFTEAAKELFLSQQAISKQITSLEHDVGQPLLLRGHGRITLTEDGKILYDAFVRVNDILVKAREDVARNHLDRDHTLIVAQPELLNIEEKIRPAILELQKACPAPIEFIHRSGTPILAQKWLLDGSVEIAFTFVEEVRERPELGFIPMGAEHELLIASAHLAEALSAEVYTDFQNERVFLPPETDRQMEYNMVQKERLGFQRDKMVVTENLATAFACVGRGEGVCFLMEDCSLLNDRTLCAYDTPCETTLGLSYRKDNQKDLVRQLCRIVRDLMKP